jgi:parallel beta-helix repeat protein
MAVNKGQITVNNLKVIESDTDPTTGGGLAAEIGSLAMAADGSGIYEKIGSGDTAWSILISGSGGNWVGVHSILIAPAEVEIVGERYQSIANALTYITSQTPSETNRFAILTGDSSESFSMQQWVSIVGVGKGKTRLTGTITAAVTISGEPINSAIHGCTIEGAISANGLYTIALIDCECSGGTNNPGSNGTVFMYDCLLNDGTWTNIASLNIFRSTVSTEAGGTIALPASGATKIHNSDLALVTLIGGFLYNCEFTTVTLNSGNYTISGCTIVGNVAYTVADGDTWEVSQLTGVGTINITVAADGGSGGGILNTFGCPNINVTNNGTWVNEGDVYDPNKLPTTLSSTNTQDAIDELFTLISGESLWDRTGTTISPQTANDNIDMGTGWLRGGSIFIEDTDNSNALNILWNEDDSADRILNLLVNGADRSLDLSGNLTVEATSLINQDLTTDASPTLAGLTLSGLVTDGFVTSVSGVLGSQAAIVLTTDVSGILPIANGGTNSSAALVNDRVMVSSAGSVIESATITTAELGLLDGMVSVSTGVADNDKLITQGYADDLVALAKYYVVIDAAGGGDYTSVATALSTEAANTIFYVVPGSYSEVSTITFKSGQELIGVGGKDNVVISVSGANIISLPTVDNVTIKNVTFSLIDPSVFDTCVINACTDIVIDNCIFTISSLLGGVSYTIFKIKGTTERIYMTNLVFNGGWEVTRAADSNSISNSEFRNILFETSAGATFGASGYWGTCTNCIFDNIVYEDDSSNAGTSFTDSSSVDTTVSNVRCRFALGSSIEVSGTNMSVKNIKADAFTGVLVDSSVIGCQIDTPHSARGIYVTGAANIISNNNVENSSVSGIEVTTSNNTITSNVVDGCGIGIKAFTGSGNNIANNVVINATNDGITIDQDKNIITGNRSDNNGGTGILIAATSDRSMVTNNIVLNNTTAQITDNGTNTVDALNITA